ncbi:MAG: cell division cycle- protein [Candelina submexicana]|nr:MAG: cell division cycle- protein [Candelina submexicana]
MGSWACRADIPSSRSLYAGHNGIGQNSFNFRDLSMKKSSSDYFSMKPVRGSSPTASLAADLSQNFHIDQSPQLPTPRRSLFTSNLLGTLENVTTPPLPSSSPGPGNDSMDISPLPHKAPYSLSTQQSVAPSSPEVSPTDTSIPCHTAPMDKVLMESTRLNLFLDRKKPTLLRPCLARTKGYSTNTVSIKSNSLESQLPPFKFGTGSNPGRSTPMSLDECFAESPPQDRKTSSLIPPVTSMAPPKPKQPFLATGASVRNTGSPINGHVRKPSTPMVRPRKQFRRSLSMFEHPGDMTKQETKAYSPVGGLPAIMDLDDAHVMVLPHFVPEDQPDSLPRITQETLLDVLDGKYNTLYDQSIVVDCRFEYEYEGGHIQGAVNYNDKELLAKNLFQAPSSSNTLLIFHCEYSAHRAPIMAKFVRHQDRAANDFRYPKLSYPEVYILDGGYSSFYASHQPRCFPQNYVEMDSKEHINACERGLNKLRQRAKLSRAQTFAFGQHSQTLDDSPTASCRFNVDTMMGMDLCNDLSSDTRRHARRMASY